MSNPVADFTGKKVTVMGLGLNGGGLESARYLALHGAECTVTDTKEEKELTPSIEKLESIREPHKPFRYVLGRHEMEDFSGADMVIKNPGVRPDSAYLAAARLIETDISLFLAFSPARLIAVTGSKGKSGTASAVHWALAKARDCSLLDGKAYLGGNITISPLSFLDDLNKNDDVVLELSSWQLGDLKDRELLKPRAAILTPIMPDHQDRYGNMESYVNDKRIIYQGQDKNDLTVACADDSWGMSFLAESPGRTLSYSALSASPGQSLAGRFTANAWIDPAAGAGMINCDGDAAAEAVPPKLLVPGRHQKINCLAAALALHDLGLPLPFIRESLGTFPGIEHRLEFFRETEGIRFYNDTAATIPEAAAAAVNAFSETGSSLVLITGGTDKKLDFGVFLRTIVSTTVKNREIILLEGTGSDKLSRLLQEAGLSFHGPYNNMETVAGKALELAQQIRRRQSCREEPVTVVLSPGCASFGIFKNEFDRGRQWKEAVLKLC